jgi:hypothetical protein
MFQIPYLYSPVQYLHKTSDKMKCTLASIWKIPLLDTICLSPRLAEPTARLHAVLYNYI